MIDVEEIAAFLTDWYDEDEAAAKAAAYEASCVAVSADEDEGCDRWRAIEGGEGITTESAYAGTAFLVAPLGYLEEKVGAHITRHDPTAVLADLAAKRRILARHKPIPAVHAPGSWQLPTGFTGPFTAYCELCSDCGDPDGGNNTYEPWPCPEVRDHAAPYADRPGFKPEWRIS